MSNRQNKHSDPYRNLRKLPLNIQLAVCLVASVLRRMTVQQEQLEAQGKGKAVKTAQVNLRQVPSPLYLLPVERSRFKSRKDAFA